MLLPTKIDLDIQQNLRQYLTDLSAQSEFQQIIDTLSPLFDHCLDSYKPILFIYNALLEEACEKGDLLKILVLLTNLSHDLEKKPPHKIFAIDDYFSPFLKKVQYDMLARLSSFSIKFHDPLEPEVLRMTGYIEHGLKIIATVDPEQFDEINNHIKNYILIKSDKMRAGSTFDALGFMYIAVFPPEKDVFDAADYIVHETAHHYIYALSTLDPLVLNDMNSLYASPLRKDPRPMLGIFHAIFVIAKLIAFLKKLITQSHLHSIDLSRIRDRLTVYEKQFTEGMKVIERAGELTDMGKIVMLTGRKLTGL